MDEPLFDHAARALRVQRAKRNGPVLFLVERALDDMLDRLSLVQRRFRRALLIGLPDVGWASRFAACADEIINIEGLKELATVTPGTHDLCVTLGEWDVANDVPLFLRIVGAALGPDALFVGAFAGNNSLPALRTAMLHADRAVGAGVSPRIHPRIEASSFAALLQQAGFRMPVVDIDRVRLRYRDLDALVRDLRGMGATNILSGRERRPLDQSALAAARQAFAGLGDAQGTVETIEIVHFAGWTAAAPPGGE